MDSVQSCEIYGYSFASGSASQMGRQHHNKLKGSDENIPFFGKP